MTTLQLMRRMARFMSHLLHIELKAILSGTLGYLEVPLIAVCASLSAINFWNNNVIAACIYAVLALICAASRGYFAYLEQYFNHLMAFTVLRDIRNLVFSHVKDLAPARLQEEGRGNLVSVLTEDIELLEIFYAHTLSPLAIAALTSVIQAAAFSFVSLELGIISLAAYIYLGLIQPIALSKSSSAAATLERQEQGALYSRLLEALDAERDILLMDALKPTEQTLWLRAQNVLAARLCRFKLSGYNKFLLELSSLVWIVIFGLQTRQLLESSRLTFEAALISLAAFATSLVAISAVTRLGTSLAPTLAAAHRVFSLLDTQAYVEDIQDQKDISTFERESCEHLGFAYHKNKPILRDVSLSIQPKDFLVIKGQNGSGKTTLFNNLMRFVEPTSGTVKINEFPLSSINTRSLRHIQTLVSQDTYIFSQSLANNLRIAKADATDEELDAIILATQLTELTQSWQDGKDHVLVRQGHELSDGQRQRIALARAFLNDAPLILLDEPTSNMDALLEAQLLQALKDHQDKRAYLIISHRSAPERFASSCLELKEGTLIAPTSQITPE